MLSSIEITLFKSIILSPFKLIDPDEINCLASLLLETIFVLTISSTKLLPISTLKVLASFKPSLISFGDKSLILPLNKVSVILSAESILDHELKS